MKTCKVCGQQSADNAVFCGNCGNLFEKKQAEAASSSYAYSTAASRNGSGVRTADNPLQAFRKGMDDKMMQWTWSFLLFGLVGIAISWYASYIIGTSMGIGGFVYAVRQKQEGRLTDVQWAIAIVLLVLHIILCLVGIVMYA